jgi:hypothetical protein
MDLSKEIAEYRWSKENRMRRSNQPLQGSIEVYRCLLFGQLLFLLGCGQASGLQLAEVEGVVTYQGKVLDHGKVVFSPKSGTLGPAAIGKIQVDGSYVMQTTGREGAAIGSHKVTVHCRRELTQAEIQNRSLLVPDSLIPDRYWKKDQSPLECDVVAGETNKYDIVLE